MVKKNLAIKITKRWGKGGNLVSLILIFCFIFQPAAFAYRSSAGGGKVAKFDIGKSVTSTAIGLGSMAVGSAIGSGLGTWNETGKFSSFSTGFGKSFKDAVGIQGFANSYSISVATKQVGNAVGAMGQYYGWNPKSTIFISSLATGMAAGGINPESQFSSAVTGIKNGIALGAISGATEGAILSGIANKQGELPYWAGPVANMAGNFASNFAIGGLASFREREVEKKNYVPSETNSSRTEGQFRTEPANFSFKNKLDPSKAFKYAAKNLVSPSSLSSAAISMAVNARTQNMDWQDRQIINSAFSGVYPIAGTISNIGAAKMGLDLDKVFNIEPNIPVNKPAAPKTQQQKLSLEGIMFPPDKKSTEAPIPSDDLKFNKQPRAPVAASEKTESTKALTDSMVEALVVPIEPPLLSKQTGSVDNGISLSDIMSSSSSSVIIDYESLPPLLEEAADNFVANHSKNKPVPDANEANQPKSSQKQPASGSLNKNQRLSLDGSMFSSDKKSTEAATSSDYLRPRAPVSAPPPLSEQTKDGIPMPAAVSLPADPNDVTVSFLPQNEPFMVDPFAPENKQPNESKASAATKFRENLAKVTLGLIPLSNEQAAAKQAEGETLPWRERPYFSSRLGQSALNPGANYGDTISGFFTNDLLHPGANKEKILTLNEGLKGLSPEQKREYIIAHGEEYREAGGISISAGGGFGEIIVKPDGINNTYLELYKESFGDIIRSGADEGKIRDLNEGLTGLSPEKKVEFIKQHAQEYKDAGGIFIPVGGDFGSVRVDPNSVFDTLGGQLERNVVYHQGNLKEMGQDPTYIGPMDDALLTMTLHPENYTKLENVEDTLLPFMPFSHYGNGTAGRIAKVGPHEIYLTAAHCLKDTLPHSKFSSNTEIIPPEILEAPEQLVKYNLGDKIVKNLVSPSFRAEYNKNKAYAGYIEKDNLQPQSPEVLRFERVETNPSTDVAIFSVDRAMGEAKVGDSIQITPIVNSDPNIGDNLSFYGRPIWKKGDFFDGKDEEVYERRGARMYNGPVLETEVLGINMHKAFDLSNGYKADLPAIEGWSGSPVFRKSEGNGFNPIKGVLAACSESFVDHSVTGIFVKPSVIRESIEEFRQPTKVETYKSQPVLKQKESISPTQNSTSAIIPTPATYEQYINNPTLGPLTDEGFNQSQRVQNIVQQPVLPGFISPAIPISDVPHYENHIERQPKLNK